jgi:type IV fimbrial biogenesis protein FimT
MVSALLRTHARGFTLPELLTVVAILATLSALAAPSFSGLVGTMRSRSASSDLFASLVRARSEAVKRNSEVTLTPTGGRWQAGWTIPNPANSGAAIEVHPALNGATVNGPASVVFLPNGRVKGSAAPEFDIAFPNTGHRCVQVDLSGRPYQKPTEC